MDENAAATEAAPLRCPYCNHAASTDHGSLMHVGACGERLLGRLAGEIPAYLDSVGALRSDVGQRLAEATLADPWFTDRAISALLAAGHTVTGGESARRAESADLEPDLRGRLRPPKISPSGCSPGAPGGSPAEAAVAPTPPCAR